MRDVVEFVVKMRDMVSGGMRGMAANTQAAVTGVNNSISRMNAQLKRPSLSIDALNNKLNDLRKTRSASVDISQIRSAGREIDRLERKLQSLENAGRRKSGSPDAGGGMLGMFGGMRGLAAGAGLFGLVAGGGAAIGAGMQAGAQKTSFEVMGGKQQGAALFNDLTKFAQDSIFGKEVYQNAQTMLAFGASVKDVMPDLKMLGDISMGNKEKLASLSLAFSQVRATGRLMGQDLLQLVGSGFNPLQIISEKTGRSMAKLKTDMEDGKISFDMVKKAFESATSEGGRFFNMTNLIANTPFGKWQALKGQLEGITTQLGTAMLPVASQVIDVLSGLANGLPGVINNLKPVFETVGSLITPIMSMIPTVMGMLQPIIGALSGMPIKILVQDVVSLVNAIATGLTPVFQNLSPLITTILQVVGDLVHKVFELAKPIISILSPILSSTAKLLSGVLSPALKLVGGLLGGLIDLITWVADKLDFLLTPVKKLMELFSNGVSDMLDVVSKTVESKRNAIAERIKAGVGDSEIVSFFKQVGAMHGQAYTNSLLAQYDRIAQFMDRAYNTKAFSTRFKELADQVRGTKANMPATATAPGSGMNFKGGGSSSDFSSTSDKITGGGSRPINIIVHKMMDSINIYPKEMKEGYDDIEEKCEEVFYRILKSANAV